MSIFDSKKIKGAELFIKCLEEEGVEFVFGLPGEENLDFLECLCKSNKIKLILTRHEQGAGFMACLLYTSPSPRDGNVSRMPSSA